MWGGLPAEPDDLDYKPTPEPRHRPGAEMSIPNSVHELAVATDRARADYYAGRGTFDEWTRTSDEFNDALEAYKDQVCPVDDEDYDEPFEPGDICTTEDGRMTICTADGSWTVTQDQALRLIRGLSSLMIRTNEQEAPHV